METEPASAASLAVETYHPNRAQAPFHADPAKLRLLLGAFGAGKTKAIIWETIMRALDHPGMLACIFRKTYPALRDTTKADFLHECPADLITKEIRTEGKEALHLVSGSRIWFRCLDSWQKQGSQAFDFAVFDEASEFAENDFLMIARGRLRGRIGPRRMVLATNPPDETHWLHKQFVVEATPEKSVHHFSTYDNAENLPEGYIAGLEKMPLAWRRKYLHGLWGFLADGEPVYQEYREELHRAPLAVVPHLPIRRGWDFGFRAPACVFVQVLPAGLINVIDELYGQNEDFRPFARRVLQHTAQRYPRCPVEDYVDIAGLQKHNFELTPIHVLRRHGLTPHFRKWKLIRTVDSIRYVIGQLQGGRPLLQVDPRCAMVNNAFAGGYYMDATTGEPVKDGKVYEHVMDALRMAIANVTTVLMATVTAPAPIRHQRWAC